METYSMKSKNFPAAGSRTRILMTTFALAGLFCLLAGPVLAQPGASRNSLRVSAGVFEPEGDSQYWDETFQTFTGEVSDFEDLQVAVEYQRRLGQRLSLVVGLDAYEGIQDQAYLDFADTQGFDILHETALEISAATVGVRFDLAPAGATVVPYLGAGGGFYAWRLTESGEFIDFDVFPEEIFLTTFEDDGSAFGYYLAAGLEIPLGRTFSIFAEAKFSDASDDLSGDFEGLGELDLSGQRFAGGFSWRF